MEANIASSWTRVGRSLWQEVAPGWSKGKLLCFGLSRQDPRKGLELSILRSVRELSFYFSVEYGQREGKQDYMMRPIPGRDKDITVSPEWWWKVQRWGSGQS